MPAFFVYLDNMVLGPYSRGEVSKMLFEEKINQDTLIMENGKEWSALSNHSEILFASPDAQDVLEGIFEREESDSVVFHCPNCHTKYKVQKPNEPGLRTICEQCNQLITVPLAPPPVIPSLESAQSQQIGQYYDESQEIPDGDLVCPHCWKSFDSDNLLYISVHPSLVGDPIVGEFEPKRFKPNVFNQLGQPLDECGLPAIEMACPCCHLRFPAGMLDSKSLYFSIAGATSSGKSYFLTCMTHRLREILPRYFGTSFFDLDPSLNETLTNYEKQLFMPLDASRITTLPATQISGNGISDRVKLDDVEIELPKPFIFDYSPENTPEQRRNLVFYDNSGELFVPGRDEWVNQATRHLSHSNGIIFLFDPTNDSGMRRNICNPQDPQVSQHPRVVDQSILLMEMISRIRRHSNMTATETCDIPLIIAVCKYDVWQESLSQKLSRPYCISDTESTIDINQILNVSFSVRELLQNYVPGLVNAAEGFFKRVYFIPTSNFGTLAELDKSGVIGIVPEKISSIWVEVPFLTIMYENGQIPGKITKGSEVSEFNFKANITGQQIRFKHPDTEEIVRLPLNYAGARLEINGKFYDLPGDSSTAANNSSPKNLWH